MEELFHVLDRILLCVIDINNLKNFLRCVAMHLVVVVKIEDMSKEFFCLHVLQNATTVLVVSEKDGFNVFHALINSLLPLVLESLLVLVEDVC